jgi:serine/threonine protein kinase
VLTPQSGTKLGPYEILEPIGAGGMGEVYKAKDTRLDRAVAIKALPSHVASNPDVRQRFEREARAVSSLNHPHICTLHDIGTQDGVDFLVMEYIEGETLADRLARGPLSFEQALRYGIQITDALDKAHRQGVVHRDLKPGNVMLTKSGVKLLDFGLAKLTETDSSKSGGALSALPTEAKPLTEKGAILGTFQYMAPEQLEGKEVDARTDIFAFGAMTYEMLTGRRAFAGKSQASLISAIMKDDPPAISTLQSMSPTALDRVVKKCVAKDPDDRWQSARDLTDELRWITEGSAQAGLPRDVAKRQTKRFHPAAALVGLLAAFLIGFLAKTYWPASPEGSRVTRLTMTLSPSESFEITHHAPNLTLSPDGRNLVYVGQGQNTRQLYHRGLDHLEATPIRGTEAARGPFFSPDGEWVGFFAERKLKKVSLKSGHVQVLCDVPSGHGGIWGPDDTILFSISHSAGLSRVSADGGAPETLTTVEGQERHGWPSVLPGGSEILFTIVEGETLDRARIAVLRPRTGDQYTVLEGGFLPRYLPTGHLLYARGDQLLAVPFDVDKLELTGSPTPVLRDVSRQLGMPQVALSKAGTMAYVPSDPGTEERRLVWVDRNGTAEPLNDSLRSWRFPRLSPDGKRLAVTIGREKSDIWVYELDRGTLTRLTSDEVSQLPLWTPDGERITFHSNREGRGNVYWIAADGSGAPERILQGDALQWPSSWSPDGRLLAYMEYGPTTVFDIWLVPLDGEKKSRPFVNTRFYESSAVFSPDGHWIAYASNETGRDEVYVGPVSGSGKFQISTDGGSHAAWRRDGRELFYLNSDKMMAVSIQLEPEFKAVKPRLLFQGRYVDDQLREDRNYDVTPDGQRFVMVQAGEPNSPSTEIHVVLNWSEELKRLVPTN